MSVVYDGDTCLKNMNMSLGTYHLSFKKKDNTKKLIIVELYENYEVRNSQ